MAPLSTRVRSAVSTAQDTPVDLEAAFNVGDTYLQPLRIFDSVIEPLADVHPYAKVVLGLLGRDSGKMLSRKQKIRFN
ncbi:uncharacterized protein BJ212DRAFT_1387759, partial [Suillus subaureus]